MTVDPESEHRLTQIQFCTVHLERYRDSLPRGPPVQYEPNPKHKPIPTPGRRGSVCPSGADAAGLLDGSVLVGKKRYANDWIATGVVRRRTVRLGNRRRR